MPSYSNPSHDEDEITGSASEDTFVSNTGIYYQLGATDNDRWLGLGGYDLFFVGLGSDTFIGGDGVDTIDFGTYGAIYTYNTAIPSAADFDWGNGGDVQIPVVVASAKVDFAAGTYSVVFKRKDGTNNNFLSFSGEVETIERAYGTMGNDTLLGSDADEVFSPGAGVDVIDGRGGFDILDMGNAAVPEGKTQGGITAIYSSAFAGSITDGFGAADSFAGIERINGTAFDDRFEAGAGDQIWSGYGRGRDSFSGGAGFDTVYLGSNVATDGGVVADLTTGKGTYGNGDKFTLKGIEALVGGSKNDRLTGDDKDNSLNGLTGDDHLAGGAGHDTLFGSSGDDTLDGGKGNDFLDGSLGNDTLIGGAGIDWAWYSQAVIVDLATGTAQEAAGTTDKLESIENVRGSGLDDTLRGDRNANVLDGRAGGDTLFGAAGDDVLVGGSGNDVIDGGDGIDTVDYGRETGTLGVNIALLSGSVLDTYGNEDTLTNVEIIFGTALTDLINGSAANETFHGFAGRDQLGGGGGNDTLYGGLDNDSLGGGDGNDVLYGDEGDDLIFAGEGDDRVYGGDDNDTIWGEEGVDTIWGGEGDDTIKDLSHDLDSAWMMVEHYKLERKLRKEYKPDVIRGEDGNDTLLGTGMFYGGRDDDTIRGSGIMYGEAGDDTLVSSAEDSGNGGGYAWMSGGLGDDRLVGGWGVIADYTYSKVGVRIDLEKGLADAGKGDRDTLVNMSNAIGSNHKDVMRIVDSGGSLFGQGGNDKLTASGSDTDHLKLGGMDGNDTIRGTGLGIYITVWGDDGNDKITISARNANIYGGNGKDTINVVGFDPEWEETYMFSHHIEGGGDADRITVAGEGRFAIFGGSGNDIITVKGRDDLTAIINGGKGSDKVVITQQEGWVTFLDIKPRQDVIDFSAVNGGRSDTFKEIVKLADPLDDGGVRLEFGELVVILSGLNVSQLSADMFIL